MAINKEMLDALKTLHGKSCLGPETHEWLRDLIGRAEEKGADIQELSARDRLEEVTQSLRSLEGTSLTFEQTKRVRAMVHYNELVLAGVKRSGVRVRVAFIIGLAIGGAIAFTLGCIAGLIAGYNDNAAQAITGNIFFNH
jgi:hypothetical protein